MREKILFKDVLIGQKFYTKTESFKKLDIDGGKNDKTHNILNFYPTDEVEIDIESSFVLNY